MKRRGALGHLAAIYIARRALSTQQARLPALVPGRPDHRSKLVRRLWPELARPALQEGLDASGVEARDWKPRQLRVLEVEPEAIPLPALRGSASHVGVDPPLEEHADRQPRFAGHRVEAFPLAARLHTQLAFEALGLLAGARLGELNLAVATGRVLDPRAPDSILLPRHESLLYELTLLDHPDYRLSTGTSAPASRCRSSQARTSSGTKRTRVPTRMLGSSRRAAML